MIDRIGHDIQQRLDQLLVEIDKQRRALAALDPRGSSSSAGPRHSPPARTRQPARAATAAAKTRVSKPPADATNGSAARAHTPPGQTRATVLAALSGDRSLTAGEVAQATGLARPTVSTTLSRLARSGEVTKADRGYRLPTQD